MRQTLTFLLSFLSLFSAAFANFYARHFPPLLPLYTYFNVATIQYVQHKKVICRVNKSLILKRRRCVYFRSLRRGQKSQDLYQTTKLDSIWLIILIYLLKLNLFMWLLRGATNPTDISVEKLHILQNAIQFSKMYSFLQNKLLLFKTTKPLQKSFR